MFIFAEFFHSHSFVSDPRTWRPSFPRSRNRRKKTTTTVRTSTLSKVASRKKTDQEWDPNCIHWHRGVSPLWHLPHPKENTLWHLSTIHRSRQYGYKSRLHGHYVIRLPTSTGPALTDRLGPRIHACESIADLWPAGGWKVPRFLAHPTEANQKQGRRLFDTLSSENF